MTPAGAPSVFVIVDDAAFVFPAAESSRYVTGRPCWWMMESPPA